MSGKSKPKIKIMVASTIYGFEDQLDQICSTLQTYGYRVWNSHFKTIPVHPGKSNTENCLLAVASCDIFFGVIRPQYGSGIIGEISITHQEMLKAIELKKPRWFVVHRDITIARQLLKQYMYDENNQSNPDFTFRSTNVIDDIRVIDLYNDTILNDVPPNERIGHWVDEYFRLGDILKCIETQFADINRIREIIEQMSQNNE
ncbi:MAG TPA: DUF4062 domain-containing protein [Pyrinomonadaceae bacterium]|nr:DUF4062 domain-containing protein [Pyrinomonadaceae bacterium]